MPKLPTTESRIPIRPENTMSSNATSSSTARTPIQSGSEQGLAASRHAPRFDAGKPWVPMPWGTSGNDGLPFFDGRNVSRFLEEFDAFCDLYGLEENKRGETAVRFTSEDEKDRIRGLDEYEEKSWTKLKEKLRKEYRAKDEEQQMLTPQYLLALSRRDRGRKNDLQLYLQQFKKAAKKLIKSGAETQYSCCRLFVNSLPEHFKDKIVAKQGLDPEDPASADFDKCYEHAVKL